MKSLDGQDNLDRSQQFRWLIEAGRAVHTATDTVDSRVAEVLDLHRSDLRCLNQLEHGPLSALEVGARLGLSSGAVTALIDRLERAGFVQRQRSSADRRSVNVQLVPGQFIRIAGLYRQVAQVVLEQFNDADMQQLQAATQALHAFAIGMQLAAEKITAGPHEN
ncbi:MarR family winged helix-turn-helix transcriptional regulator [Deinococcus sp.]|uniref:MarR family winged helix-turn-helix transcriptional regulator n=1 Tax=Deinococcus sp. TaxID=47478 RepID=UPI003CC54C5E